MDALHQTLETLLGLARANEPASVLPVNVLIDRFVAEAGTTPQARFAALEALEAAYADAAPQTELGSYARLVIGQRRRLLSLDLPRK